MDMKSAGLEFQVAALGMGWGIARDIYGQALALAKDATGIEDFSPFDRYAEIEDALQSAGPLQRRLMTVWNDRDSELRVPVMEEYVDQMPRKLQTTLEASMAFAMMVKHAEAEEGVTPAQKAKADDILEQIGTFHPKGPHPLLG